MTSSPRSTETRASTTRAAEIAVEEPRTPIQWKPPSNLDAPPARTGFRQRWVATSILGKDIPHWVYRQFRQGWTPRKLDTVSDAWRTKVPTISHGQYAGFIGVEGHVLCEMPEEMALSREAYFRARTKTLQNSINKNLDEEEKAGGVRIQRTVKETVRRGVNAAPDSPDTD